jgi:hypothetical protein
LRKWKVRWLTISRLWDLIGARWYEESKSILLEIEHRHEHVTVSTFSSLSFHYINIH